MVLSPIDYVIIALYFIVIVAIGFIAARFRENEGRLPRGRQAAVVSLFFGCMAALTLGGGSTIGSAQLGSSSGSAASGSTWTSDWGSSRPASWLPASFRSCALSA